MMLCYYAAKNMSLKMVVIYDVAECEFANLFNFQHCKQNFL